MRKKLQSSWGFSPGLALPELLGWASPTPFLQRTSMQQHQGDPELNITESSTLCSARSASKAAGHTEVGQTRPLWCSHCPFGHDGIAGDRAVQRGSVYTAPKEGGFCPVEKREHAEGLEKQGKEFLTGTECWRTGGNWAWGGKQSKYRKLFIMYKQAKNMAQNANFVCSKVSSTAKLYCLKNHRTFRRKEKPSLRLSKDILPVSAMKAIIWISY